MVYSLYIQYLRCCLIFLLVYLHPSLYHIISTEAMLLGSSFLHFVPTKFIAQYFYGFLSFIRQSHSKREAEMWEESRIPINEDRNVSTVRKPNISTPLGTVVPAQMGNQAADSSRKVYTHGIHHNPIVKGHWISIQFPASLVLTSQQPALCPRFLVY